MSTKGTLILAVDILPIRRVNPNVITLIGDITTDKCRSQIRGEMQGAGADVVLCDGAPNVGASYDKDAYEQNEIALYSLRCATEHLKKDGTFVTKLYRSSDYSSYLWVAKALFRSCQAVKPSASRSQSAEIFLVCTGYLKPDVIDPRMLDPRSVFEQVDGAATGGGDARDTAGPLASTSTFNIFHKKYNEQKRRRGGYDMSVLDATMRHVGSVSDFVSGEEDPIKILGTRTGLGFTCPSCKGEDDEDVKAPAPSCACRFYLDHPLTTSEIKACLSDLKVLNRSDFKGLLTWRLKVGESRKKAEKKEREASRGIVRDNDGDDSEGEEGASSNDDDENNVDSEEDEEAIQSEIEALRERKMRERKRQKKKERKKMSKSQRRKDLGMDLNAVEVPENEKIFSLATITSRGDLEAAREVDLSKVTDEQLMPGNDDPYEDDDAVAGGVGGDGTAAERDGEGRIVAQGEEDDLDEDTGYSFRLDRELDDAYDRYLGSTRDAKAKAGTKMAKRTKKLQRQKAADEAMEDEEMDVNEETRRYAKLLNAGGPGDDDDESADEEEDKINDDDDGFHSAPKTPEEHARQEEERRAKKSKGTTAGASKDGVTSADNGNNDDDDEEGGNPLIYKGPRDSSSVKTARWFSNPLFENLESAARSAGMKKAASGGINKKNAEDYDSESDHDDDGGGAQSLVSDDDDDDDGDNNGEAERRREKRPVPDDTNGKKSSSSSSRAKTETLTAENVIDMMPKTDKVKRHEKRVKAMARQERKLARKAREEAATAEGGGEGGGEFEIASAPDDDDVKLADLPEGERKRVMEARALIRAGMGAGSGGEKETEGFEVVSAAETRRKGGGGPLPPLPAADERKYDSDHEDYDSDDYARTLALGTMMLRRSKAKALVDASYNRYAWNDPEDLPDWLVDDENRNYRPNLPIPEELVAKIRERQLKLTSKPIARVAEARARKNKRARTKLAAAKKKAETVANSNEMSEAMKLKAISKAMRGQDSKRPGKTYVVSAKGGKTKGGKGVKLVDKRMKNDKRSMERSAKKRKSGKQGGLTGSKKRRRHN